MFCRNCGARLPEGSVFCTSCGQDLRTQSQPPVNLGSNQNQSVQMPGTYSSPGFQMPPVQYPPRRRNTGLIVLISVLAVVVVAAIIVICVLVTSPKDTPVAEVSSTPKISATLPPTAAPTKTTPATTESAAPVVSGTISGFPYDFVQLNYPEATFLPKSFGSIEEFESELTANAWDYYEARNNANAVSFNGGFVDIGYGNSAQVIHEYVFSSDYTLKNFELDATTLTAANEYSNSYWTQESENVYIACYNMGVSTELNGVTYKAAITVFINDMGDLAEFMALYDPYNNVFIPISNYDIYKKSTGQANNNNNDQEAAQKEFESALQSKAWTYYVTQDATPELSIEEYSNIMPESPYKLIFSPDMTLEFADISTGEAISDEPLDYAFGKNHAYAAIDQYELSGVTYEIDLYYYINADGNLEEQMMAYDSASGKYYPLSNINVYKAETP